MLVTSAPTTYTCPSLNKILQKACQKKKYPDNRKKQSNHYTKLKYNKDFEIIRQAI